MKRELKEKWIKALRSGEYKQAQRRLRTSEGFCCLGVLCDLVDSSKWEDTDPGDYFNYKTEVPHECYLPTVIRFDAGLSNYDESQVANMNDDGKSFLEIADHIERNL